MLPIVEIGIYSTIKENPELEFLGFYASFTEIDKEISKPIENLLTVKENLFYLVMIIKENEQTELKAFKYKTKLNKIDLTIEN